MSTFDVLDRYGTAALLRLAVAVALFVVLHLVRLPLVLLARVLEVSMRRVDGFVIASVAGGRPGRGEATTP